MLIKDQLCCKSLIGLLYIIYSFCSRSAVNSTTNQLIHIMMLWRLYNLLCKYNLAGISFLELEYFKNDVRQFYLYVTQQNYFLKAQQQAVGHISTNKPVRWTDMPIRFPSPQTDETGLECLAEVVSLTCFSMWIMFGNYYTNDDPDGYGTEWLILVPWIRFIYLIPILKEIGKLCLRRNKLHMRTSRLSHHITF